MTLCQGIRDAGAVRSPKHAGTIGSSVAFGAAGVAAFTITETLEWILLAAFVLLMIGSAWFHYVRHRNYPVRHRGRLADRLGMYFVLTAVGALGLGITHPSWIAAIWGGCALAAPVADSYRVIGLLSVLIVGALIGRGAWLSLLLVGGLFALASLFRQWDQPDDTGWWHSAWHVLMAADLLYLVYLFTNLA